ncbi:Dynein heavy chain, cytoplasmic [Armadillidium nasatum]|uniref:Dynein heavy chain, cytoplasmic n=1 Tax=Armadillidium nasatum TaxID=96803 RepID=A0A5N5T8K3_9CRUS|nr:Dynein heavy chain, cytoplasmic [Armadillidium nasatum]
MTLFSALRALPDLEVVGLNFSSATNPELVLKTFDHYYQAWVKLERIQFVGACNPPTDPGRKPLSHRFLRHVPVVYVDYPGELSLKQIYGTFNRAMLRIIPSLRSFANPLTNAMVEFYLISQEKFTQDMQPHYVYSPREMTRWVRGICEAIRPLETLEVDGLVRLWAHEALRLFHDRLVTDEERKWTNDYIDLIAMKHFPNLDREKALVRPILYSNWLSKDYLPVEQEELREYVKARLKVFYEEELDVPLVLFNEVLDHVLRIDRIFRQPQGHLLLIGASGAGKTTLSRFVAWMNGLSIFQNKGEVHNKYTADDFDEDLRSVLRRSGCKDEKICFILDESNVLDSSFLERMNTLLANGEVPGLFERHYLDFINHFVKLYNEKRSELEEQQLHLNVGLGKIAETVEQVEQMQKSLTIKNQELQLMPNLKQMVKDQQEAEKQKVASQELQEQLEAQEVIIKQKREDVMKDLSKVEPAVQDAQNELLWPVVPMVKWAIAQIEYADMLKRVEPLRNELQSLEMQAEENKKKHQEVKSFIDKLERSIAAYKDEYAVLISQAQALKADLESVQAKVDRSMALIRNLSIEKDRWASTSDGFRMSTIIGDVLLSSAFLAYGGYFDQQFRQNLFTNWCTHLLQANIQFRPDIARTEYLSNPDERLRWQASALPTDELCTENAIMLKRFNRYPLIIDPSGQATEFIMNEFKEKKITKTSFLDDSFRKNLESALRFGNPLLVQDVENYDPILNPVLNRELRRTGGRVLITLGDQDIDLSPAFTIFLSTRDPTVEFPPDICSRVTFVNFTVTRSSLQSQCLNQVLKAERPDIDDKRSNLLKLQGEFQLRLRHLEKNLLQVLNDSKGQILDDDSVITTLETLKKEAADISLKVQQTDKTMNEIEMVSQQYMPLSSACSNIYFTLDSLHQVHSLYQYSLKFFLNVFTDVLTNNPNLNSLSDHSQRLSVITNDLFKLCFSRVASGMLHNDHLTLAVLLARIRLRGMSSESMYEQEFQYMLRSKEGVMDSSTSAVAGLTPEQTDSMRRLISRVHPFQNLERIIGGKEFQVWLESPTPEMSVPVAWETEKPLTPVGTAMYSLLLIQAFRPDRFRAATAFFVNSILGDTFLAIGDREMNMASVVEKEVKASTPVLMCSVPGFDASARVDDLAAELNIPITAIAIGSAEGFSQADKAINSAVKNGRWVMLKNVHLAPGWLVQLEKKLHSLHPHPQFRLFLTMEINPRIPVNLLRAGRVFVFEPPPGIKANLLRTFNTVPASRMMRAPSERARLYFILAWFHAITQERLRYAPLGWAKHYEFNESDLRVACDTLDTWIEATAMGRTNLPPEKVPWDAISTLLSQCIYGGKIDNEFDQRLLSSFLVKLFTPKSFELDFPLVKNIEGTDMLGKLLKMQVMEDDDDLAYGTDGSSEESSNTQSILNEGRPLWMITLHQSATTWLALLPESIITLRRTLDNIKDPLYRYFEREVNSGSVLLRHVRNDLTDVILICKGEKKQTNYHRSLLSQLVKGMIPNPWKSYTVPRDSTVIQWITDFAQRVRQLQDISKQVAQHGAGELKNHSVWLGGLFNPEAYITATRQCVAQANSWSLEELALEVSVSDSEDQIPASGGFAIKGLKLQGAVCRGNVLKLTSAIMTELPLTTLIWTRHEEVSSKGKITLPVYLNATRSDLLFTVDLPLEKESPHNIYERGVALLASTNLD